MLAALLWAMFLLFLYYWQEEEHPWTLFWLGLLLGLAFDSPPMPWWHTMTPVAAFLIVIGRAWWHRPERRNP